MEEIFEFDLDFLDQPAKDHLESSVPDLQELAFRIAETNNIINIMNSLKCENDVLKSQLSSVTKSTNEVHILYENEKLRANGLSKLNKKYSRRIGEMKKVVLQLQSKLNRKFQGKWKYSNEKNDPNCTKKNKLSKDRYLCNITGHKIYSKFSNEKFNSQKNIEESTEIVSLPAVKICNAYRFSRMLSRGTQYQYSTTTRATCTSAFIRKHNVAVNFPEVISIPFEQILQETMEIPNLLSPIQDAPQELCNASIQTQDIQNLASVGTCNDLTDIANEFEMIPNPKIINEFIKTGLNFMNHTEESCPNLSNLLEFLGHTIFKSLGSDSIDECKTDLLKRKLGQYYDRDSFLDLSTINVSHDSNLKGEMKQSVQGYLEISLTKNSVQFHMKENKPDESKLSSIINKESKLIKKCPWRKDKLLNDVGICSNEINGLENDRVLAAVQKEIESLEKKTLVLSPIRERGKSSKQIKNMKVTYGQKKMAENCRNDDYCSYNAFAKINEKRSDKEELNRFTYENPSIAGKKNSYDYMPSETPRSPQQIGEFIPINSLKIIPLERLDDISNYSPSSPKVETVDSLLIPSEIPIERTEYKNSQCMQSLLGRLITNYNSFKHSVCAKNNSIETPNEGKVLRSLRKIIELYLIEPEGKRQREKCAKRILRRCIESRLISTAIFEVIEDTAEEISNEYTPPVPVMTRSHLKIILLIEALNACCIGIDKKLIFHLDQRIFNLKPRSIDQKPLINLLLLYLGLIDLQESDTNPARLIIYKSLYYYNKMSFPMVYFVLVSYPNVLPVKDNLYCDDPDPLVDTIQSILNSQPYDAENTQLKHREIFHILRLFYKYERMQPSREKVVEKLLLNLRSNKLRNISYSFALLCKRNSLKWSMNFVLKQKLLPTFIEYASIEYNNNHNDKIACLLDSISSILKAIPVKTDISSYRQLFVNILHSPSAQSVQEAAALALLRTSKFGHKECFKHLYKWNPLYRISRLLHGSINTFIHRKTLKTLKRWENKMKSIREVREYVG